MIAVALGLDDDQVPVLLRLADSKLDHLIALSVGAASNVDPPRKQIRYS